MKGSPPWRQEGKGCIPTGGHGAGAASSGAQIGAPNAGGWIYPPTHAATGRGTGTAMDAAAVAATGGTAD
eukprot:13953498-Heterocapsa_arctica.AAC.1